MSVARLAAMDELFDLSDVTGGYDFGPNQEAAEQLYRCSQKAGRDYRDADGHYSSVLFWRGRPAANAFAGDARDRYARALAGCVAQDPQSRS